MIVIEIRIGREPSARAAQPPAATMAGIEARGLGRGAALQARKAPAGRWIWRLGRRGIAAAVASVLGVASLAFVPGSSSQGGSQGSLPVDGESTRGTVAVGEIAAHPGFAAMPGQAPAGQWQPSTDSDVPNATPELERRARQLTEEARARVAARALAGQVQSQVEPPSGVYPEDAPAAPVLDSSPSAPVVQVADAAAEPAWAPSWEAAQVAPPIAAPAIAVDVDAPFDAGAPAAGEATGAIVVADPVSTGTEQTGTDGSGMHAGTGPGPAATYFSISRAGSGPAKGLPGARAAGPSPVPTLHEQLRAMGERAAASDWAGVRAVLEQVRATAAVAAGDTSPASATDLELALTLAKWDARSALASGQPAHAAVAFDGLDARIDDEARALRAVAWLRSGDAALAVDAYRDLLARSPRDARLWLGLALALESSAGTPDATRFAYLQTLELAQDEAVRAVARARLAPPQA